MRRISWGTGNYCVLYSGSSPLAVGANIFQWQNETGCVDSLGPPPLRLGVRNVQVGKELERKTLFSLVVLVTGKRERREKSSTTHLPI